MIDAGAELTVLPATVWEDCGTSEALLQTNRYLLSRGNGSAQLDGSVVVPPVFIAPTARISKSVIGPYASIGDDVVIENAIVRDSIIDAGAAIESALLAGSIVGRKAFVRGEAMRVNVGDSADIDLQSGSGNGRG
jgi:glucose-1-phosphate thymidylyltransferase